MTTETTDRQDPTALHPVRAVVERTGLTPDLLRAWERRYRAVEPQRSAGRQRLYSETDIARLSLLKAAVDGGWPISHVAPFTTEALKALAAALKRANEPASPAIATADGDSVIAAALDATERCDDRTLEMLLRRAALHLGVDEMLDRVLSPLLFIVGSLSRQELLRPANEHLARQVIRRTLTWMMDGAVAPDSAPLVVVGTPSGRCTKSARCSPPQPLSVPRVLSLDGRRRGRC